MFKQTNKMYNINKLMVDFHILHDLFIRHSLLILGWFVNQLMYSMKYLHLNTNVCVEWL